MIALRSRGIGWDAALLPFFPLAGLGLPLASAAPALLVRIGLGLVAVAAYAAILSAVATPSRVKRQRWHGRGLVVFLHVAQSCARSRGWLRGPGPPTSRPLAWSGDRLLGQLDLGYVRVALWSSTAQAWPPADAAPAP
jgi:hypothetical protein